MKTKTHTTITHLILAASIAFAVPCAQAASLSERLEKGIYAEETKGDLDAAIVIYEQLVKDGQKSRSLAAEAQYRLGLCLEKKNRTAEATAAFEKLITDFPTENEWLAKARQHLPDALVLGPVLWVDGERLQLVITTADGTDIGTTVYRADLGKLGDRSIWRVGTRTYANGNSFSQVDADANDFKPISSQWKQAQLGEAFAVYHEDEVDVKQASSPDVTTLAIKQPVFDNEQAIHVMRRLPLAIGYKATLPVISTLSGTGTIPIGLEVTEMETVKTPAGEFEAFKTRLSVGQTMWFANDEHRTLVRFGAGGIEANLVSVTQERAGQPVAFNDPELGVSFTMPANWVAHRRLSGGKEGEATIYLLDPKAESEMGLLRLFPASSLSDDAQKSPRAWAEADVKKAIHFKDVTIRPESWKTLQVSGQPAVSLVIDGMDGDKPRAVYATYVLGTNSAAAFNLAAVPENIDALMAPFESIIASFRMTK
ncbi:MAG: tetratricopeptide repeat protein [Chthoniobacteraceae bacterium]